MIDQYLNQSLTWKHVSAISEYNEKTYSSSTIKGRKESCNKLIRNASGQESVVSTFVATESAISVNDLIDDKLVVSSEPMVNLDGAIEFYEVYLL